MSYTMTKDKCFKTFDAKSCHETSFSIPNRGNSIFNILRNVILLHAEHATSSLLGNQTFILTF